MSVPTSPLSLDPALLARIADLELAARLIVEGARLGSHRSPFTGSGAEFQQMRPYLPGDDLKHLDWKHYARTDRLFTRVYRETTEWPVMLAIDTSRSMAFVDHQGMSKLRMGALLAAALTYLLVHQGEAVGLVTHPPPPAASARQGGADTGDALPARTGRPHLVRMLGLLSRIRAGGGTDLAGAIRRAAARLGRRGCLALISDLYGADDMHHALREVRRMGHEVVVFHVLSPQERRLEASGDVEFVDLETDERLIANAPTIRDVYAARVAAFIAEQRAFATAEGITFVQAGTDRPIDLVLRAFTQQRAPQAGGGR
ncbi:hypothetical protein LuPra_03491 [Luteitalea pratensis]|uniref:DUF58 domain-containing protein n=1 Tax=Luteitalea pratensis TaxID=1855912 RepID=A0A143PPB5_LUTPR|nr:DUF58 domain-containing protein [Luteitalea pratensis]AMY10261.1 hypothetical protein LuPra_03491 [Luteitalea pratensis]